MQHAGQGGGGLLTVGSTGVSSSKLATNVSSATNLLLPPISLTVLGDTEIYDSPPNVAVAVVPGTIKVNGAFAAAASFRRNAAAFAASALRGC